MKKKKINVRGLKWILTNIRMCNLQLNLKIIILYNGKEKKKDTNEESTYNV